ncbi:MAG: helix-turn-helix transcriptional regulator [Adlercreutzia sp.]|nr:helix-turn-helix transcriptional regulator [Adlercreutzia sp.]
MKLPHIKVEVEYREEDTGAPGKMSPALIAGFGLHWAWVYLFMFNGQYVLFPALGSMQLVLSATSGAFHALTLLAYALFLKQARLLFGTPQRIRFNRLAAAIMIAAATALCLVGNVLAGSFIAGACFFIAGAASGIGSAVLLMSFGVSFSVCDLPTIALCTALSVVVSALVFSGIIMVSLVLPLLAVLAFLVLPFAELFCLNRCSADLVDKLEFAYLTMPVRTAMFAGRIGVPSVVFGLLLGVLRTCALAGTLDNPFAADGVTANLFSSAVFTAALMTCLSLIVAMLALRKSRYFTFRVLVPLIGVLLALLCSDWGEDPFFHCFALFGSYFMLEMCLWVMYADVAQTYRVSAFTTFGFGHGFLSAGSLIGFLALQTGGILEPVLFNPVGLVVVGLITLTLGVAVLPNAAEIRSTLLRGRRCPAVFEDLADLVGDAPAPATTEAQAGALVPDAEPSAPRLGAAAEEAVVSAPESSAEEDASVKAAELSAPTTPGQQAEQQAQQLGRFKRKCAVVADTFLLSRKETEVLFLLAKGRNSAAIQESLYISAGTANTHMRHIYRKLDVHSQHELIELVESMELD